MDQNFNYQPYTTPADVYQIYYDYSAWSARNQNYYSAVPAYRELNSQQIVDLTMDLTDEVILEAKISQSKSPTQARDFKLTCESCKRSFTSKKRLENHQVRCKETRRNDTNPFSCKECIKSFKKRSSLLKHTLKHHDGKQLDESSMEIIKTIQPEVMPSPQRSIFHSINLLAESDRN